MAIVGRIGRLFRGFLSLFISGIEESNPEALLEAAKSDFRNKMAQYNDALARLDAKWPGGLLLVTQNVDDLHERAGSTRLLHMHGELTSGWCLACDERFGWAGPMGEGASCPACGLEGQVRPDIVWFGEMPYDMDRIDEALHACDLFVSIGTSGAVYPAAGFVQTARYCGARTLEINLEPSLGSTLFDESRIGRAGELVPRWVDEVLGYSAHSRPISL